MLILISDWTKGCWFMVITHTRTHTNAHTHRMRPEFWLINVLCYVYGSQEKSVVPVNMWCGGPVRVTSRLLCDVLLDPVWI